MPRLFFFFFSSPFEETADRLTTTENPRLRLSTINPATNYEN